MTDKLKGCTVVFDRDIREDDAEEILKAIRMVRGVQDVTGMLTNPDDWINRSGIRLEYRQRILDALKD